MSTEFITQVGPEFRGYQLWRASPHPRKAGKLIKRPCHTDGRMHSLIDPCPPLTAQMALSAVQVRPDLDLRMGWRPDAHTAVTVSGVAHSLVGIDADDAYDEHGKERSWSGALRGLLRGAYFERTVSGRGWHAVGYMTCPRVPKMVIKSWFGMPCQIEVFCADGDQFLTLGEYMSGDVHTDITSFVQKAVRCARPAVGHDIQVTGTAFDDLDEQKQAEVLHDAAGALAAIPNTLEYDDWQAVGHWCKAMGEAAWPMFEQWSATSPRHCAEDCAARWASFKPTRSSYRTLFAVAERDHGWQNPRKAGQTTAADLVGAQAFGAGDVQGAITLSQQTTTAARARAVASAEAGQVVINPLSLNDSLNAAILHRFADGRLKFCKGLASWFFWAGDRWESRDHGRMVDWVRCVHRAALGQHIGLIEGGEKHITKSGNLVNLSAAVKLLSAFSDVQCNADEFDADPWLLGIDGARQVVELRTGVVRPARREDRVSRSCNVDSLGDPAKAVRWLAFWESVQPNAETRAWLGRALGYCVTGSVAEQTYMFWHGAGGNGKGVITNLLVHLLGDYACATSPDTFSLSGKPNAGGATPDLVALLGKRLIVSSEQPKGRRMNEDRVKALVAGDAMAMRKLFSEEFTATPVGKLILVGNNDLTVTGTDEGIWRRTDRVEFNIKPQVVNAYLGAQLREEGPHIMAWLVQQCLAYQAGGIKPRAPEVEVASSKYREDQDEVLNFLTIRCIPDPAGVVGVAELYREYANWAQAGGTRPITRKEFNAEITKDTRRGWVVRLRWVAGSGHQRWGGLKIAPPEESVAGRVFAQPETPSYTSH